jgi:hypothetical protein
MGAVLDADGKIYTTYDCPDCSDIRAVIAKAEGRP